MVLALGLWAVAFSFAYSVREYFRYLEERDKLRQPERELALLPEIIKAYGDVTGDQGKAEELSALLTGIVRGSTSGLPERLERIEQSLDAIKGYLEQEGQDEEEEEEDPLSPNQLIRAIHDEHTKRVQALFDNMAAIGGIRPSSRELFILLQALRPGDPSASASPRRGRRERASTDEATSKEGAGEPPAEPAACAEEAPPTEPTT
jgi:hypothetical protein